MADGAGIYFSDIPSCDKAIERLCSEHDLVENLQAQAREKYLSNFTWPQILEQYENLLISWLKQPAHVSVSE